jgi:hypothetical protein
MKLYSVTAQVVHQKDGWQGSLQIPAFILTDRQVRNEVEAQALGRMIVDPMGHAKEVHVCVTAL